jgi:hypothetical protein
VGESLTYQIHWTSGPTNLPAGEATLSVVPPLANEAFRFALSARTAPWVSRFFESAAALETTATDRLLPLAHQETINEGRRRVERQLEFDFARHEVRMVTGGNSVVLPLAPSARDPLSALFYVRTLPLTPSSRFTLPLSDNGRASQLEVSVGSVETIVLDGRPWSAWKLEPRQRQRIEREDPPHMTVWLSADARRVPLRFDVAAGFGSVRAELREVLH